MVVGLGGVVVGGFEVGPGSEGGGEHEDGGFWGVEVSEEGVDELEFVTGVHEDVGFAGQVGGFLISEEVFAVGGVCDVFKSAGDGGAEGNDSVIVGFG